MVFVELEGSRLHVHDRCVCLDVTAHGVHEQFTHRAEGLQVWIGQPYWNTPPVLGRIVVGYPCGKTIWEMRDQPRIGGSTGFSDGWNYSGSLTVPHHIIDTTCYPYHAG